VVSSVRAEDRFRDVFRRAHAAHASCTRDEWLRTPCSDAGGVVDRPLAWSRRNGPWQEVPVLLVGAAPGNAGGRGSGDMGAHATRIPFGGDVAGANLDVLLAAAGLDRNGIFIVAALNRLPDAGGGEPTSRELAEPVGDFATSLHLLRATLLAARPRLLIALGNVGLRATISAATGIQPSATGVRMPGLARLRRAGLERNVGAPWPEEFGPDSEFLSDWESDGARPLPRLLWLTHPSAQNMSPYAGVETAFHQRMVEARDALTEAVRTTLDIEPPAERPEVPTADDARRRGGVYALPEWLEAVGPRHAELSALWRHKGV